jgi:hypothetical protein
MGIQPPCWIRVLSLTMRNAPVGSTCGKNAEIAIAAAATMISPLVTAWLHQRDQRGVHSETAATPRSATTPTDGPGLLGRAVLWDGRQSSVIASDRAENPHRVRLNYVRRQ